MPKVSIEIDTDAKTISAVIDGQDAGMFDSVSVYKMETYDDEERMDISLCRHEKEGKISHTEHYSIYASQASAQPTDVAGLSKITNPFEVHSSKLAGILKLGRK